MSDSFALPVRIAFALYVTVDENGNAEIVQDAPEGPRRVEIGNAAIPALRDVLARVTCPDAPPFPGGRR